MCHSVMDQFSTVYTFMEIDGNSRNLIPYTKMSKIEMIELIIFRHWAFLGFNKSKICTKTPKIENIVFEKKNKVNISRVTKQRAPLMQQVKC